MATPNLERLLTTELARTVRTAVWELLWLIRCAGGPPDDGWVRVDAQAIPQQIAQDTGLSKSAAFNSLRVLETAGLIRRRRKRYAVEFELKADLLLISPEIQNSRILESCNSEQPTAPPGSPLPQSPSPPKPPKSKDKPPPNGGAPPAPDQQFPPEAHDLVNAMWNYLQVRDALPPTPQKRTSWRMSNLHFATKQCLVPSSGKTLADWLGCLEWAGAQPYWAPKITSLSKLMAVWPEFQMHRNQAARSGTGRAGGEPRGYAGLRQMYEQAKREEDGAT